LDGACFLGDRLVGANLVGANLDGANLAGAHLDGARLLGARLVDANLADANLVRANLVGANLDGANLADANLADANLVGANLDGANLAGAYLAPDIKATAAPHRRATRADGWEFLLWHTDQGWRIDAGCRFFTPEEARVHWNATRPLNTPLGAETHDILTMFEAHMARQVPA